MEHYCGSDTPPWTTQHRANWYKRYDPRSDSEQNLRVGDTERQEMADILGRHYADGRLDKMEFDERLGQAMSAKTRSDLDGLLSDLPPDGPSDGGPPTRLPRRRHGHRGWLEGLAIAIAIVLIVGSLSAPWHFGWLVFVLIALFVWDRRGRRGGRRHWHPHDDPAHRDAA